MAGVAIANPKRDGNGGIGRHDWYSLYAGYSPAFAVHLLASLPKEDRALVLDPWNGAGTTTTAAAVLGIPAIGLDLNPAMVVAARGVLVPVNAKPDVLALRRLADQSVSDSGPSSASDPLGTWFTQAAVRRIRSAEQALVTAGRGEPEAPVDVDALCTMDAFAYLAIFRVVRRLLQGFYATNPTWLKKPRHPANRLRPSCETIRRVLVEEVDSLLQGFERYSGRRFVEAKRVRVAMASSCRLPLASDSVACVLSSPPYCTRIDYAVATSAELAVLGYGEASGFNELRLSLIGTARTTRRAATADPRWGTTCRQFLRRVRTHKSKASSTYYLQSHVDYFSKLYASITEIGRVLKPGGHAFLVVQDSFYKDVHNDLQASIVEMALTAGLELASRVDFPTRRSMAQLRARGRVDSTRRRETESVLQLVKGLAGDRVPRLGMEAIPWK